MIKKPLSIMNIRPILLFLALIITFSACNKSDFPHEADFDRSYKAWLDFKASNGDNYRYEVSGGTWAGSSWLTTITVREGKVIQRDFTYTVFNDVWMPENGWTSTEVEAILESLHTTANEFVEREGFSLLDVLHWSETEDELGTKANIYSPASALHTLDDIYDKARNEWLQKRTDAHVTFEANNNGMISAVGFVPDGCMDDCFSGIHIRSIEALE